jgi:SNF2 family DNA or RNA helicase
MAAVTSSRRRKIVLKDNPSDYDGNEEEKVNDWGVTVELYNHQKTSVKRMEYIEENRIRKYTIDNDSRCCTIDSNFGILNDKVGAGKTLTCISLISREINTENYKNEISTKEFVNIHSVSGGSLCLIKESAIEKVKFIPITIVVVPNSIIFQWRNELKKSNLKFKIVSKIAEIKVLEEYVKKVNACAAVAIRPTPPPPVPFVSFVVVHCKQNPSAGGVDPPTHSKFHSNEKFLL